MFIDSWTTLILWAESDITSLTMSIPLLASQMQSMTLSTDCVHCSFPLVELFDYPLTFFCNLSRRLISSIVCRLCTRWSDPDDFSRQPFTCRPLTESTTCRTLTLSNYFDYFYKEDNTLTFSHLLFSLQVFRRH